MSFVLRFFHAPEPPTTVRAAVAWADSPDRDERCANPRFARFVASVSEYFPDLSGDDDEGEPNLWPEGLEADGDDGEVVNVLVETALLDPGVMTVIARHADAAGLQILDEQNGLLFGPGLRFVGMDEGPPSPLPEVTAAARAVMRENLRGLRFDQARRAVAAAVGAAGGPGWTIAEGTGVSSALRLHGELRQIVSVRVIRSTEPGRARLYCSLGFASEALAREWLTLLPAEFAKRRQRYDAAAGGAEPEFAWFVPRFDGALPASLSLATDSRLAFGDAAGLQRIEADARDWAASRLQPFLEDLRTADDLRPLALTPAGLEHARRRTVAFPAYPAMLALARREGGETLEAWADAYRANDDFGRLCRLFKDPPGAHLDALVEGLRARG